MVLSPVSRSVVHHTSPQSLRLRDDCRHLLISVARGPAYLLHGPDQIGNSWRMSVVETA